MHSTSYFSFNFEIERILKLMSNLDTRHTFHLRIEFESEIGSTKMDLSPDPPWFKLESDPFAPLIRLV